MRAWLKDVWDTVKASAALYRAYRHQTTWDRNDWYKMPAHGWTCYHCGETFMNAGAAAIHFGERPSFPVGCSIDIQEYRRMRAELHAARMGTAPLKLPHRPPPAPRHPLPPDLQR